MSQNELQRVMAEVTTEMRNEASMYGNTPYYKVQDWASRIEAAQAVAPGGGERCGANLHARRDPLYCAYPKGHEGPHGPRNYVDNRAMLAAAPDSEAKGAAIGEWWCERNCDCVGECKAGVESKPTASSAAGESTSEPVGHQPPPENIGPYPFNAEQEQAGELSELPEPVSSVALAAWGPKPDYYTADQMHAYARTALLRRAARVDDAMAGRFCMAYFGDEVWERTRAHHNGSVILEQVRAALTAALEPKE